MGVVFVRRTFLVLLLASIGGTATAQEVRKTDSNYDALLAEVRSLRAELHEVASVSVRMQLLIARLQLQEQRVLAAGRDLAGAQSALTTIRQEIAGEQARVEQLEKSMSRSTTQAQGQIQQAIREAKVQIEQQERQQQELQAHELELQRALNTEQSRWSDFNDQLDALERSMAAVTSR